MRYPIRNKWKAISGTSFINLNKKAKYRYKVNLYDGGTVYYRSKRDYDNVLNEVYYKPRKKR